jgi:hypothetical protein
MLSMSLRVVLKIKNSAAESNCISAVRMCRRKTASISKN